jgi:hypothetical protein
MSENKNDSRTLRVLLLVCAGALLVIVVTMASDFRDAQSAQAHATQQALDACGMPARVSVFLPANCQTQNELR